MTKRRPVDSHSATYSKSDSGCPAGLCLECPLTVCKNDSPKAYKIYIEFMRTKNVIGLDHD